MQKYIDKANTVFDKLIPSLSNLKFRWEDERGFEEFKDYKDVVTRWLKQEGVTLESMTKGFRMKCSIINNNFLETI